MCTTAALDRACGGADCVFHLATPSYASYSDNLSLDRWARADDTVNVLAAAHRAHVRRLVYSSCEVVYSSCESVYGVPSARPVAGSDPSLPLSPYAFTKMAGEQQCVAFSAIFGMETVRLRYSNVFGPRQISCGARPAAISDILKAMLQDRNPVIEGDGQEPEDYIYVDDVVHANLLAAEAPRLNGKVYNIARGRDSTLNDVVAAINNLLGTSLQPQYTHHAGGSRRARVMEIARAETELGFCAGIDLEHGLRRCIAYHQAHPEQLGLQRRPETQGPHFAVTADTPAVSQSSSDTAGRSRPGPPSKRGTSGTETSAGMVARTTNTVSTAVDIRASAAPTDRVASVARENREDV
jgi:nucleoside-diphosphate-sugar epimerase